MRERQKGFVYGFVVTATMALVMNFVSINNYKKATDELIEWLAETQLRVSELEKAAEKLQEAVDNIPK